MMQPRESFHQLTLFQPENQLDQHLQYTMVEQANMLARVLAKRRLPTFYFNEAAQELGITAKTCRSWKMNTWPIANRPSDENLVNKVAIYIRVYLRLRKYPKEETYQEAKARLHRRIRELDAKKFSRNQIAQQMPMSFRTLKDMCDREGQEPTSRSNHCPWNLLQRLEKAEEEITRQKELQTEFQDLRVLQHPQNERWEPDLDAKNPLLRNAIPVGGACRKCQAEWHNLKEDGADGWKRPIMVCIICGAENAITLDLEDADNPDLTPSGKHEFIERYAACRHCHAYWNHMKLDRTDRWNNRYTSA